CNLTILIFKHFQIITPIIHWLREFDYKVEPCSLGVLLLTGDKSLKWIICHTFGKIKYNNVLKGIVTMKIVSIEPTPSPHSMKVNIDEKLPEGENQNFQDKDDLSNAPEYIQSLFEIEGVKGLYQVQDFITIQRNQLKHWKIILPEEKIYLVPTKTWATPLKPAETAQNAHSGEINVFIQMFRNIPMQVKLQDGETEE